MQRNTLLLTRRTALLSGTTFSLARQLPQPIVLTLHTVLSLPSVGQAETLRALCGLSTLVCAAGDFVDAGIATRMVDEDGKADPNRIFIFEFNYRGPRKSLPGYCTVTALTINNTPCNKAGAMSYSTGFWPKSMTRGTSSV